MCVCVADYVGTDESSRVLSSIANQLPATGKRGRSKASVETATASKKVVVVSLSGMHSQEQEEAAIQVQARPSLS